MQFAPLFFMILALVLFILAGCVAHMPPAEVWWRRLLCFGAASTIVALLLRA